MMDTSGCGGSLGCNNVCFGFVVGHEDVLVRVEAGAEVVEGSDRMDVAGLDLRGAKRYRQWVKCHHSSTGGFYYGVKGLRG